MSDTGFFTIPAGQPFALDLARALLAETGGGTALAATQIWLPSRRAQRAVQAAFTELSDGAALLMPDFCLLGEADADALDILEAGQPGFVPADALPDAVHPLARQILLARQIEAFVINGQRPGPAQAFKMAEELAGLLDQLQRAGCEIGPEAGQLADLLPAEMAIHWQSVLAFVRIVSDHWPALLAEQNKMDPVQRQQKLIDRQIALWQANPPASRVILAGSTGSQPATRRMMRAIAALPAGAVILPGLEGPDDTEKWAEDWAAIGADAGHPLHILHDTLAELEVELERVRLWPGCEPEALARRRKRRLLLAEAFRPAAQSAVWRRLAEVRPELDRGALSGLHLLNASQNYQQAAQIALLMREMLEHPGKRAMLVTPDRALARQVQAELRKWQIEVDDSAGTRLADTMPGRFLQLICEAVASDFAPLALASLAKHPLCAGGLARPAFTRQFQQLEKAGLRGPLAGTGWQGLQDRLADRPDLAAFAQQHIFAPLAGLHALMHTGKPDNMAALAGLAAALGEAAEKLAAETEPQSGILRLYAGPAGEAAGRLLAELIDCEASWPLAAAEFPALLQSMAEQVTVRSPWETHPNLAILGTVEARLQSADRIILAGLNEGVWPPAFVPDIWMNETARKELGLPDRRWRTALSAHDFMMLAGADEVWITRADRNGESPAQSSRWLARLQAVLTAGGLTAAQPEQMPDHIPEQMPGWMQAALQDRLASTATPCPPPAPKPALPDRPRKFSATDFDKWISDPYAIYAARVLHLKALPELDERPGPALRGSLIHKVLGKFLESCPTGPLPGDAEDQLEKQAAAIFARWSDNSQVAGLWRLRLAAALDWFLAEETRRRSLTERVCPETDGQITLTLPAGEVQVTARADRLELLQDGTVLLADYKTGAPPRKSEVEKGRATQLLVEAVIAAAGGFSEQQGQPGKISALEYWQIKGQAGDAGRITSVLPDDFDSEDLQAALTRLIQLYDDPDQPYLSEPDPAVRPKFSEVRHLARVREWRAWEVEDD